MMGNLTGKQWLSIAGAVLSVLMISTAQLTDLFGATTAKSVVSVAGLANMIINSVMAAITGQSSLIRDVAAMPGVSKIDVNSQANQTLAQIALDPKIDKVGATPQSIQDVINTASGTKP